VAKTSLHIDTRLSRAYVALAMFLLVHKCSEYSINWLHIRLSGLWEYGHGQQFVGSSKKCTALSVSI